MTSEIKVDTISEQTSANGVTIDGLTIKDGNIIGDVALAGTTPTFTIGDAGAEDAALIFDGNAQDFYIALDDSADDLVIGTGSTVGSNAKMVIENGGNVGIGTASPGSVLQIDAASTPKVTIRTADGTSASIKLQRVNENDASTDFELKNDGGVFKIIGDNSSQNEREIAKFETSAITFNEGSEDIDFRVESADYTHALHVNAGNNSVSTGAIERAFGLFNVSSGDSNCTDANNSADEFVIEVQNSINGGMSILTDNSRQGSIMFGDQDDDNRGIINYDHSTDDMFFSTNGNGSVYALVLHDSNAISTSGETAPDVGEGGITLDQNAADTKILTFKSSDVAHGITNEAETDTYAAFDKNSSADGGLDIVAFSERTDGEFLRLVAAGTSIQTTKAVNAVGAMHFVAVIKNGTAFGGCDADDNLLTISNGVNTRFIFDNEGTMHSDVGTATYDAYEDAHLVRAMDLSTSTKGLIASKFDEFVQYNHEDLANASIVGRDENGTPNTMVNWTAMSQLHNGAIWQQYEKHQKLTNAMYELAKAAVGEDKADAILKKHDIKLLN